MIKIRRKGNPRAYNTVSSNTKRKKHNKTKNKKA